MWGWCHSKPWEQCYQSCEGQAPAQQNPQRCLPLPRYQGMKPSRDVGTQPRQKTTERMRLLQGIPARKMHSGAMWIWLLPWSKSAEPLVCSSRQRQLQACKLSQWGLPCGLPAAKPWGQVYPSVHRRSFPYPSGPSRESIWWKSSLRPWDLMFALLGLDLLGTCHPLLSYFSL